MKGDPSRDFWLDGAVNRYPDYSFKAKVYDIGSVFGIEQGRISKLQVRRGDRVVMNYDRGWDQAPNSRRDRKPCGKYCQGFRTGSAINPITDSPHRSRNPAGALPSEKRGRQTGPETMMITSADSSLFKVSLPKCSDALHYMYDIHRSLLHYIDCDRAYSASSGGRPVDRGRTGSDLWLYLSDRIRRVDRRHRRDPRRGGRRPPATLVPSQRWPRDFGNSGCARVRPPPRQSNSPLIGATGGADDARFHRPRSSSASRPLRLRLLCS